MQLCERIVQLPNWTVQLPGRSMQLFDWTVPAQLKRPEQQPIHTGHIPIAKCYRSRQLWASVQPGKWTVSQLINSEIADQRDLRQSKFKTI